MDGLSNEKIVDELDRIRDRLYRDQPDTFSVIEDLIDLIQAAHCRHLFKMKVADGPDGTPECKRICDKCGLVDNEP